MKNLIGGIVLVLALYWTQQSEAANISVGQTVQINLKAFNGAVLLEFDTTNDVVYQIQFSRDGLTWDNEGYSFRGTGGRVSKTASGRGLDQAFYRLQIGGDPQNAPIANPSREWVAETTNRESIQIYTNFFSYEINIFVRVGATKFPNGDSRSVMQTRKLRAIAWINVGEMPLPDGAFQRAGSILAIVPGGWEYRLLIDGSSGWSLPVVEWNELK